MPKPKVYVSRQLFDEAIRLLEKVSDIEVYEGVDNPVPRTILADKIRDADGLLCLLTDKIDSDLLSKAKRLRVIANYAVGFNNIDIDAATRLGIYVTNTPDILTETTADFAFAHILAAGRRIAEADRHIRSGKWVYAWGPRMFLGNDVNGKTLGIVGPGRIGTAVAERARGFKMRVVYTSHRKSPEFEAKTGAEWMPLDGLLRESDFVTVHIPLTDETRHIIGKKELESMKRTACLINTSRGPVVDEVALAEALRKGTIAGAGLDVFEEEPLGADSLLLKLENVVLTPHIASASVETRTMMATMAATSIAAVLTGNYPLNLVNPDVKKIRPLKD